MAIAAIQGKLFQKIRHVAHGGGVTGGAGTEHILMVFHVQNFGDSPGTLGALKFVCLKSIADQFVVGNTYPLAIG